MGLSIDFITTDDGSHSLFNAELKESYHSTFGAILESNHIFIEAGLKLFINATTPIHILEVGFGTGLNGLLSSMWASQHKKGVNYLGIEAYLIGEDVVKELNYPDLLKVDKKLFTELHKKSDMLRPISPHFQLQVIHGLIQKVNLPLNHFEVVYFDAFSPSTQPEMWSIDVFRKIFNAMKNGGVLTTYSTKGDVKRGLKEVGFFIEKIPGPPGKREILRAYKK